MTISDEDLLATKISSSSLKATILHNQKTVCCNVSDAEEIMEIIHNAGLTPSV